MAAMAIREGKQFPDYYLILPLFAFFLFFFNIMMFPLRFSKTWFYLSIPGFSGLS